MNTNTGKLKLRRISKGLKTNFRESLRIMEQMIQIHED